MGWAAGKSRIIGFLAILVVLFLLGCIRVKRDTLDVTVIPEKVEMRLGEWINLTASVTSRGFSGIANVHLFRWVEGRSDNLTYSYRTFGPESDPYYFPIKVNETVERTYSIMWELATNADTGEPYSLSRPITVGIEFISTGREEGAPPDQGGISAKSNVVLMTILPPVNEQETS